VNRQCGEREREIVMIDELGEAFGAPEKKTEMKYVAAFSSYWANCGPRRSGSR